MAGTRERSLCFSQLVARRGYLYFEDSSQSEMRRVQIPGKKFENIASLKEVRRPNRVFGFWSKAAYDGSPLVMLDAGTQEIYALELQFP